MTGANLAAPLYATYAARYGFSSLVLTAIFATYAVTLVPSLVLFGRLSDRFGRRPVMLAGLAAAASRCLPPPTPRRGSLRPALCRASPSA